MPPIARDRLTWLLTFIPQLADDEWHRIDALEREHGPLLQHLLPDLYALSNRSDVPAGFVEGVQILLRPDAVSVRSNHFLRPVRLSQREAAAIELGLALLESERPPDERPAIERVRELVRKKLTAKPVATVQGQTSSNAPMHAEVGAIGNPKTVATLRRAMKERKVAEIDYQRSGSTAPSARRVHPYSLTADRGKWMLWAWCERSGERKAFRVDRMRSAKATDDRFERPEDADNMRSLGTFANGSMEAVSVRYSPTVSQWVGERIFESSGTIGENESVTIDHPLKDDGWAVRNVLQYGPEAIVVKPKAIRDAVRATLEAMLSAEPSVAKGKVRRGRRATRKGK